MRIGPLTRVSVLSMGASRPFSGAGIDESYTVARLY